MARYIAGFSPEARKYGRFLGGDGPKSVDSAQIRLAPGEFGQQYRSLVDEARIFYDVSGAVVEVLAIVAKSEAQSWLAQFGNPE
jgi:hypothetical protein